MSPKNTKLTWIICLLSGVLLCILGCNAISEIVLATPDPNRFPVKSWNITMELDQREQFFTQLQNFADKHSLELRSTFYDADKKGFFILLTGDGFHISAISRTNDPSQISIFFYNEASPPTSQEIFDELAFDLKSHLKETPSMIIKKKLKRLSVSMDESQSEELFTEFSSQLRNFADQHSLEITIISSDSDLKIFLIEMDADGFQITSESVLSPIRQMNVDFYIHYDDNGTPTSVSQETIDELFSHLINFFGKIPNVTITEVN